MNNDELLLQLVREIHDDQKEVVKSINTLTLQQAQLKSDLEASRNGYTPHEVVAMLHWVDDQMVKQEKQTDNIKSAFVNWLVPILSSAVIAGLVVLVTKGII
jgi:hypothetical protein